MKSTMKLGAMALAAMLVLSVFAPAALAAGAAEDETTTDGNVSVSTSGAENVTNGSAVLYGEIEGVAENDSATVYFTYWVDGNKSNTTTTTANETIDNRSEFTYNLTVTGLQNNTTYVYVANADVNNTTYSGEESTFTTGAQENETDEDASDVFGQEVSAFVHQLLGNRDDSQRGIGQMVSEFVTKHNPGADKRPAHAGPPEDRGKADKADKADKRGGPKNKEDKQRGPPTDKGKNKDDADTEDVESEDVESEDVESEDEPDDDPTETSTETETETETESE